MTTKIIETASFQTFTADVKVSIPFIDIQHRAPFNFEFEKQLEGIEVDCPFNTSKVNVEAISPLGFDEADDIWFMFFRVTCTSEAI